MRPALHAAAGWLCLAGAVFAHRWLEASMLRHMLLQLPLLAAAGWLVAGRAARTGRVAALDEHGLSTFTALIFVSAYWMVPRALELSLTAPAAQAAKFASLLLTGALLPGALKRANRIVQLFFLGNLCAMMAIAGMLYQDMPQRLCNAYLLDDQVVTGTGLVLASLAIAAIWCLCQIRSPRPAPEAGAAASAR